MNDRKAQRIRDPVHGLIVFGGGSDPYRNETDQIAWNLINTREFQRLRRIRQLGFSDLVYPGATHSRLAHSIGVYHTARQLVEVIRRRQDNHDPERARIVLLAALLHDIGHGPFSHAFENAAKTAGLPKHHETWSSDIIQGDTDVNRELRQVDENLPSEIGALLTGLTGKEGRKDIYASVVSSQFDADRLDYIQRDRLMAGVEFGHLDLDWLFDCLEIGSITTGTIVEDGDDEVLSMTPCFYLNPKGLQVAVEYLEARFRLYMMVYMHKTTRAAERMLGALLSLAAESLREDANVQLDPVLRYFTSGEPALGSYLDLDDSAVWATLTSLASRVDGKISDLANRLRNRQLYKCVDIGIQDSPDGNLYSRFRRALSERYEDYQDKFLFDDATVAPYKLYDFNDESALNKLLVKSDENQIEPVDIAGTSEIIKILRRAERVQRVYAPDRNQATELHEILQGVK